MANLSLAAFSTVLLVLKNLEINDPNNIDPVFFIIPVPKFQAVLVTLINVDFINGYITFKRGAKKPVLVRALDIKSSTEFTTNDEASTVLSFIN